MIQRNRKRWLSSMPIKWKLTLWSAFFILLLFIAYNSVQYIFVEKWMIGQEKVHIRQQMNDVLNELLEKEVEFAETELPQIRNDLNKKNQKGQLIRIINKQNNKIISVSDGIPEEWIPPKQSALTEIVITDYADHSFLIMRSPITIHSFKGTVEIVKNIDQFKQFTEDILRVFVLSGLGAVILSGLGGGLLAQQLLKPLQSMAMTIQNVGRKGLQERMEVPKSNDEIAILMKMFNKMMDQVEQSFHQQSQFVEDASHELRTPIAIIDGHLSLLLRWGKHNPSVMEESLNISYHELTRMKSLVQDLLLLTSAERDGNFSEEVVFQADQAILKTVGKCEQLHPNYTFETSFEGFEEREMMVSDSHLEQILMILLDNAVKYSEIGSAIRIAGYVRHDKAFIEVTDRGIGIPEKDLPFVMERFYRVDKTRSRKQGGTGLGLAIAKRLIEQYNGQITIQSKESLGTTVTVSFTCHLRFKKREAEPSE
ncbi:ATP-binding protein [Lysinibacillus sp. NPDC093197]|uniref:HAMP domain-containing sensor histidine kinase n=1 Tax=Lysinibacillus sp. NPDC093197 TaxID=3364132 RepID=UPI00380AFAE3